MPYVYDIKIDFHSDWIQVMQIALTNLGYSADESLPSDRLSFQFFNVQSRLISPVPRKILLAKDFHCPPAHQNGLEMLKSKIIAGDPLNPYQSKGIRSLTNNDALLNDWGIHHLHLGTIEENGFVNRTGPVLFARFDNEHAYFIKVMDHGKGNRPWTRQEMIHILHKNWPESINQYRVKGIAQPEIFLSDEEYTTLRKFNGQSLVHINDGTSYFPIGGGNSSAGTSIRALISSDFHTFRIRDYERYVREFTYEFIRTSREQGLPVRDSVHYRLWIHDDTVYAFETISGVFWKLGELDGSFPRKTI